MRKTLGKSPFKLIKASVSGVLFLILVIASLAPIWIPKYFPSEDGQLHVQTARALAYYTDAASKIYREYYTISMQPEPNVLGHIILAALVYVFKPVVAEKIYLTIYILLLTYGFRYCLKQLPDANRVMALFIFPFVYSYPIMLGFYNYALSFAIFFIFLGYWNKHRSNLKISSGVISALLLILIFFSHPVPLVLAWAYVIVSLLWPLVLKEVTCARFLTKKALPLLLILAPTVILLLLFISRQQGDSWFSLTGLKSKLIAFFSLSSLYSFDFRELILTLFLSLDLGLLLALSVWRRLAQQRRLFRSDDLLLTAVLFFLVYVLVSDSMAGGGMLLCRLLLYPYLFVILWLSSQKIPPLLVRLTKWVPVVVSVIFLIFYTNTFVRISDSIQEYISCVDTIEANSTLLPIHFTIFGCDEDGWRLSDRVAPFMNAGGYIAARKSVVDLSNLAAWTGYALLDFRSEVDPSRYLHTGSGPYWANNKKLIEYNEITVGTVDYVLLWQYSKSHNECRFKYRSIRGLAEIDQSTAISILNQLDTSYELVYVSPKRGLTRLYRRIAAP